LHGGLPGQRHRTGRVPQTAHHGFPGAQGNPASSFEIYHGIRQKTDPAYACVGCATCSMVCPNDAIFPMRSDEADKLRYHINRGGQPRSRGGRRNAPGGILDQIKFIRISMLTDPALDAGRHEFEMRSPCWAGFCRLNKT
jgi:glutamate synthase (NADPH/NADH) large chain